MPLVEISSQPQIDTFFNGTKPFVVALTADWCHYCKKMKPDYYEAARRAPESWFLIVPDLPSNQKIHQVLNPKGSFPTIMKIDPRSTRGPLMYQGSRTADSFIQFARF